MSLLITRTFVIPTWLLVCVFVVVWTLPPGPATGLLVLFSGLAVLAIVLLRKPAANARVTPGLPTTIDLWPLSVTAVPRQTRSGRAGPRSEPSARPPFSWPNSGFRNIGRGTKRG